MPVANSRPHLRYVTVSMRVMSAGDGYKYLLRSIASGDGDRSLSTPLTRYYMEEGTPPSRLIAAYVVEHGKRPSPAAIMKLRAQAILTTRPVKEVHSLSDLTETWRARASEYLGQDATAWAWGVADNPEAMLLHADGIP